MNEQDIYINEIKNILKTLRFHMSLEKNHFTYIDLMIHHNPKTVNDYKYIRDCLLRELKYRKTLADWREARSKYHGFYWSHFEKTKVLNLYLNSSGDLVYDSDDNDEVNIEN